MVMDEVQPSVGGGGGGGGEGGGVEGLGGKIPLHSPPDKTGDFV